MTGPVVRLVWRLSRENARLRRELMDRTREAKNLHMEVAALHQALRKEAS